MRVARKLGEAGDLIAAGGRLALLRKLTLTLLKREQSDPRKSIVMKRRRVGWDNDYLFTALAAAAPPPPS